MLVATMVHVSRPQSLRAEHYLQEITQLLRMAGLCSYAAHSAALQNKIVLPFNSSIAMTCSSFAAATLALPAWQHVVHGQLRSSAHPLHQAPP